MSIIFGGPFKNVHDDTGIYSSNFQVCHVASLSNLHNVQTHTRKLIHTYVIKSNIEKPYPHEGNHLLS